MQHAAPIFEAVIVPHRSLSPRGLRILTAAICVLCGLSGALFLLLGAWPVIGFSGVEVGLAVFLLRLNARAARATELILLTERELRIVRRSATGARTEQTLRPAWLSVLVRERAGRVPALLLVTRDGEEEIARELGEMEKRDLAEALRTALHRWRHPIFDNPQLRD